MEQRLGEWTLVRELARGGMGVVWLAHDQDGREVAIKVLGGEGVGPGSLERFQREARVLSLLRHPNIVLVHRVGEEPGRPFIVMDYVPGGSLAERLKREGRLPQVEAALLGARLARALEHAHAHGVLHRDLKPQNVLLGRNGEPLLSDFGLAWDARDVRLTATGMIAGTPAYMSPEQADGLAGVDGRADVYSLGATLYHLITGRPPFTGESNVRIIAALVRDAAPAPSSLVGGLHPELEAIVNRCLAKRPEDRPQSAAELAAALEGWLGRRGRRAPRRSSRAPVIVSVCALAAGGVAVALILFSPRASPAPVSTPLAPVGTESGERARLEELWARGQACLARKEFAAALELGEEAVRIGPDSPIALYLRGEARRCTMDHRGALADLDRAVSLSPDTAAFLNARGLARWHLAEKEGGLADLARAVAIAPSDPVIRVSRAEVFIDAGDFAASLPELDEAIRLFPTPGSRLFQLRAQSRWAVKDVQGALEDLSRAVELEPNHSETWFRLGVARDESHQLAPALVAFDRALELSPSLLAARTERSNLRRRMGDTAGAAEDARIAVRLAPRDARAALMLSVALLEGGDLEGAGREIERTLALDPRSRDAWQNRAALARLLEDWRTMRVAAEKVLELAPEYPRGRYLRGYALARLGLPGAREDLEAWLEVTPTGPEADTARQELAKLR